MEELKYYEDSMTTILLGDCRDMSEIPDGSVHCAITSPPYWGKRKYNGEQDLTWSGDESCQHKWGVTLKKVGAHHAGETNPGKEGYTKDAGQWSSSQGQFCSRCGAWSGSLGLEPTPEFYIQHLVEIFREVKRVLRKDGVCWINIGDSYNSTQSGYGEWTGEKARDGDGEFKKKGMSRVGIKHPVIKPLDRVGIPEMLVLALRADGWYWRSTIIWHKPSVMPESLNGWRWEKHKIKVGYKKAHFRGKAYANQEPVPDNSQAPSESANQDIAEYQGCPGCELCLPNDGLVLRKGSWRPTNDYEVILMLTKTSSYFSDREAVATPSVRDWANTGGSFLSNTGWCSAAGRNDDNRQPGTQANTEQANLRAVWSFSSPASPTFRKDGKKLEHFAAFPEELPRRCIMASTSDYGVCAECGAPYARIVDTSYDIRAIRSETEKQFAPVGGARPNMPFMGERLSDTLGWRKTCSCGTGERVGATVLDPFAGTGTTLAVTKRLGRKGIGYDLSLDYVEMSKQRVQKETAPMLGLWRN